MPADRRRPALSALALAVALVALAAPPVTAEPPERVGLQDTGGETSVRVPVWARGAVGTLVEPYLSAGLPAVGKPASEGLPLALRERAALADDWRLAVGAGLGLKLTQGLNLYGEYRFLRIEPHPGAGRPSPGLDSGGFDVKGGLSIAF
jgi:hypothetical protein